MKSANHEELQKVLQELCKEKEALQKKIDENNISIQKAEHHIRSITEQEEEDYKVFSPKNKEDIYHREIDKLQSEKAECQKQNKTYLHERNKLNSIINILNKISNNETIPGEGMGVFSIQEEERQRIARDLHDISLQNLAHLVHKIELGTMFIDQDPVRAKLEFAIVSKNIKEIINDMRNIVFNLRPMIFDDMGLKAAFERFFSRINMERRYDLDLQIEDISCENKLILTIIYRIVQEAVNNIEKHAEADKIKFYCWKEDDSCRIEIEDNGMGYTEEEAEGKKDQHFGISLMKEKVDLLGGTIKIKSKLTEGTKIFMKIPLE